MSVQKSIKNGLTIFLCLLAIILIYTIVVFFFKENFSRNLMPAADGTLPFKYNEFGDYIGGVLNPLFTLLSTFSVLYLTYIIAKGEDVKAEKAIETQKRITLNQMRQTALDNLIQKTNLYVNELNDLPRHEVKGKLHRNLITNLIKEERNGKENSVIWLVILNELENFSQLKYLFSDLFNDEEFKQKYNAFIDVTAKLCDEQNTLLFINIKTLQNYISCQQEFLTVIGDYIYSEF